MLDVPYGKSVFKKCEEPVLAINKSRLLVHARLRNITDMLLV